MKTCLDCKYCVVYDTLPALSSCSRPWYNLVDGRLAWPGGQESIYCWMARQEFCGTGGVGWESKNPEDPYLHDLYSSDYYSKSV